MALSWQDVQRRLALSTPAAALAGAAWAPRLATDKRRAPTAVPAARSGTLHRTRLFIEF
jgi:hypothetical protein